MLSRPVKRKWVHLEHLDRWADGIHVVRREILSQDAADGQVILISESSAIERLHIRSLVAKVQTSMLALFDWTVTGVGIGSGLRQHPLALSDVPTEPRVIPPRALDIPGSEPEHPIMSATLEQSQLVERTLSENPGMASVVLAEIVQKQEETNEDWVPFSSLEEVDIEDVHSLEAMRAVRLRQNEFGELEIRVEPSNVRALPMVEVGFPTQIVQSPDHTVNSKLDLVLSLFRNGWSAANPRNAYADGASREFFLLIRAPRSYFVCLLEAGKIFEKGILAIKHKQKDLYYQALLRLRGEQLIKYMNRLEAGESAKVLRRELKNETIAAAPICDDPPDELHSDEEPSSGEERVLALPAPPRLLEPLNWKRATVTNNVGTQAKVYFDHYAEDHGRPQRAYCNCIVGSHQNCFQWRQTKEFESREQMCAYFFAWASRHGFENRQEHMAWRPSADEVAAMRASAGFRLVDF